MQRPGRRPGEMQTIVSMQTFEACNSIAVGPSLTVDAPGDATFTSPLVIFTNGVSVLGRVTVANDVP